MRTLALLLTLLNFTQTFAQQKSNCGEWKLKQTSGKYRMFTRQCDYSAIKEVKILYTFELEHSFEHLADIVGAVETSRKMNANCIEARFVQPIDAHTSYQYFRYNLPLGLKTRDVVSKVTTILNESTYTFIAEAADKSDLVPLRTDAIRIKSGRTVIIFKKIADELVEMEYCGFADPGGNIPAWIVNVLAKSQGYSSTMKMIKLINE